MDGAGPWVCDLEQQPQPQHCCDSNPDHSHYKHSLNRSRVMTASTTRASSNAAARARILLPGHISLTQPPSPQS